MQALLTFILGGITGRIRGGLLKDFFDSSTTTGRYFWAANIAGLFLYHTGDLPNTGWVFILAYLGALRGYFKGKFDLALPENKNPRNYLWLTLAAMARCAPLAIGFCLTPYFSGFMLGVFAGALAVPAGLFGVHIRRYTKIQGHTQYAEFLLYGAILTAIGQGL